MNTQKLFYSFLFGISTLFGQTIKGQDLVSINVGTTLPKITYNTTTSELTVQMTIRNTGFFNSTEFDVALFLKNVNTNQEIEIDRTSQSGLSYTQANNANTLQITNWKVKLENKSQVPSGDYRVIAKINDNKNATESNYNNNNENFGNESFKYEKSTTSIASLFEQKSFTIYPNPSTGFINLALDNSLKNDKNATIEIFNAIGSKVQHVLVSDAQKPIDLTSFAKGVYYVKITSDNKKYTQKISIL